MTTHKTALLFPGQGAYYGGALAGVFTTYPEIKEVFSHVDHVAQKHLGVSASGVITQSSPLGLTDLLERSPEVLQLAIYGVSVATYGVLRAQGLTPDLLIGHSFGEIAALVCAGAFTVAEGAEIVCHRMAALQSLGPVDGYMAAVGADLGRVEALLASIQNPSLGIAVENSPTQTVVSGPTGGMAVLSELATALKIPFVRLASPYPFHSILMRPAVADFAARLRHLRAKPLGVPVFSPILGRLYTEDDVLTECFAQHLVQPVRFPGAITQAWDGGVRVFVESGALDTLGKMVKSVVKTTDVTTVACLHPKSGDRASLAAALDTLRGLGVMPPAPRAAAAPVSLLPDVDKIAWDVFWAAQGPQFLADIRREFESFEKIRGVAIPSAPPSPEPAAPEPPSSGRSRAELSRELTALYAGALEYPPEVFTDAVELEAELGIDSVKQTELLTRVSERYGLPPRPADFRLSDYHTMGKITDFVFSRLAATGPGEGHPVGDGAPAAHASAHAGNTNGHTAGGVMGNGHAANGAAPAAHGAAITGRSRAELSRELTALYAGALEYPPEVFTDAVELEAELGIDSVKQTELLTRVSERYGLPPRPADFRLSDYHTMGKITDFVFSRLAATGPGEAHPVGATLPAPSLNGRAMAHAA